MLPPYFFLGPAVAPHFSNFRIATVDTRLSKAITQFCAGTDPNSKFRVVISVIFGIQVSLRVHFCKRGEVYFTTLLL